MYLYKRRLSFCLVLYFFSERSVSLLRAFEEAFRNPRLAIGEKRRYDWEEPL